MIEPVRTINNISEYLECVFSINELALQNGSILLYRGHSDCTYRCQPGILRGDAKDERDKYHEIVQLYPEEFKKNEHLSNLVKMQHYGLSTRLLDFSTNPLVSLYFAAESRINKDGMVLFVEKKRKDILVHTSDKALILSCLPLLPKEDKDNIRAFCQQHRCVIEDGDIRFNTSMIKLMHEIRAEYPAFETKIVGEDLLNYYFLFANRDNARMKAQCGAFVIFGLNEEECSERLDREARGIIIKNEAKKDILRDLACLQINPNSIYPSLENMSMYLKGRKAEWTGI